VLTDSAVALARTVGYVNAGTVEFLVDPSRGTEGLIGVQVHVGGPMKVEYRNWRLRIL